MNSILLQEVVVIFGLSIVVLLLCHRLHIPTIVGFLLTGLLSGPHGLGLVNVTEDVQSLADLGVVLLLFAVGIEFSIKRLLENKRFFLLGGGLQIGITALIGFFIGEFMGRPVGEAVFLGFLLSLSSTAIVLRVLEHRQEMATPSSKVILGILICQDIVAVPMMLMTPYLAGYDGQFDFEFLYSIGLGLAILGAVFFAAIKLVPLLMHQIARTRSRELFLLTTLSICFSVAWITASLGLSLSLGAFLAGLIVSETEYRSEAIEDVIPFQDVFTSFFFISVGMLLDLEFLIHNPLTVASITIGVLLLKSFVAGTATLATGMPLRTAVIVGMSIPQVGEFSFVLARTGMEAGLATTYHYQLFLAIAVITMALTPLLMRSAHFVAEKAQELPFHRKVLHGFHPLRADPAPTLINHVLIIGFGMSGKMVASSCRAANITYAAVEIDPDKVREERLKGEPIFYGDATHSAVLHDTNIGKAHAIAVMTNDPLASLRIVEHARGLNEDAYIVVRTRYVDEMKPLFQLGADEVIPDEFGSSVEIFTRIMQKFHVESAVINEIIQERRREGYELLRLKYKEPENLLDLKQSLIEVGVQTINLTERSIIAGKKLSESGLRDIYGVNVVLIKRGEASITEPSSETALKVNDTLILVGAHENLKRVQQELV